MIKQIATSLAGCLLAAVTGSAFLSTGQAQTYTEVGDAGNTLSTAQLTAGTANPEGTPVTIIRGSFNAGMDADLFAINITSPSSFSATTNLAPTTTAFDSSLPIDTTLFLFDGSGNAVATNDDTSSTIVTSTLALGNALYANLSPGLYYLGISISGNEPVNTANQLLFALSDDSTDVRGPEASNNLNPLILDTFDQDNYDNEAGSYGIMLTGVTAVPEPSTRALTAVLGGLLAGYVFLRRRPLGAV